jgi:hypothetical protein
MSAEAMINQPTSPTVEEAPSKPFAPMPDPTPEPPRRKEYDAEAGGLQEAAEDLTRARAENKVPRAEGELVDRSYQYLTATVPASPSRSTSPWMPNVRRVSSGPNVPMSTPSSNRIRTRPQLLSISLGPTSPASSSHSRHSQSNRRRPRRSSNRLTASIRKSPLPFLTPRCVPRLRLKYLPPSKLARHTPTPRFKPRACPRRLFCRRQSWTASRTIKLALH